MSYEIIWPEELDQGRQKYYEEELVYNYTPYKKKKEKKINSKTTKTNKTTAETKTANGYYHQRLLIWVDIDFLERVKRLYISSIEFDNNDILINIRSSIPINNTYDENNVVDTMNMIIDALMMRKLKIFYNIDDSLSVLIDEFICIGTQRIGLK